MPTFRATNKETKEVIEYDEAVPRAEHLNDQWKLEQIIVADSPVNPDEPVDTRKFGGRRRLSKLEFLDLFTDTEYGTILAASKQSIPLEAWIKKVELATPDADGMSMDLDDPRTQAGVHALAMFGLLAAGRDEEILNG